MHALLITATIEPGREDESLAYLHSDVVPRVRQAPGLVSGYWLSANDGQAVAVLVFENEAAQRAAAAVPNTPRPEFVTLGPVDVREVVAHT